MSTLRPDIQSAMDRVAASAFTKAALRDLPTLLWEGETVRKIVPGLYGQVGLLVLTDRRLIFTHHHAGATRSTDFAFNRISSIEYQGGMLMANVTVFASGAKATIRNMERDLARDLVDAVRGILSAPPPPPAQAAAAARVASASPADQLVQIKRLYDMGILTEDEYTVKRQKLVSQL